MALVEGTTRYGDLCRLCATKTSLVLGLNIFETEGNVRQINNKIHSCLPIQVHEEDELPKMICGNCLYKLEQFFEFRERSIRTEALLIDLFKEIASSSHVSSLQNMTVTNDGLKNDTSMDIVTISMSQHHQQHSNNHLLHHHSDIELSTSRNLLVDSVEEEDILHNDSMNMESHPLDTIELGSHNLSSDLTHHALAPGNNHEGLSGPTTETEDDAHYQITVEDTERLLSIKDEKDGGILQQVLQHKMPSNLNQVGKLTKTHRSDTLMGESVLSDAVSPVGGVHATAREMAEDQDGHLVVDCWYYCNICGKTLAEKEKFEEHYEEHFCKCTGCLAVFTNKESLNVHRKETHCGTHKYHFQQEQYEEVKHEGQMQEQNYGAGDADEEKLQNDDINEAAGDTDCQEKLLMLVATNDVPKQNISSSVKQESVEVKQKQPPPMRRTIVEALDEEDNDDPDDPLAIVIETGAGEEPDEEDEEDNSLEAGLDRTVRRQSEETDRKTTATGGKKRDSGNKVCKVCGKSYKTNYKLAEHMRKHTGEQPFKCSSCEKAFRSKIGLAQHEAKHTGQYEFSCPTCGKGFQCKSYLVVHQRVHSDLKPYPCTTCGRNFKTKQSLLDHMNRHLGVKPFMCEVCGRGFITKGLCKSHQKIHTGLDNRKFSCKVCSKMFVSKSYLQTHLRIHTGEKPFMCEVCGKGFLTRVDLRIHSTMHTGEKSYVCEMCGKAFARRDALRCHRRSHTGERPYRCDQCGQTFTQFSPMAIHKRLHTGERPYSCEVCGKTFVSRSTMMAHWKKHVR